MKIAKVGDTIEWCIFGKTHTAKVTIIDKEEKHYGVYCDYGQDLIPFNKAVIKQFDKN